MAELTLATLAAQAFTGLVLGMILVLLAIGLSLIFGLMTVVNFAHGSLYMLGAYLGFFLIGYTKSFWLALVVAPLLVGPLGFGIERFLVRPLYGRSIDDPLLLTFGLSLVMIEAARLIWGKIGLTLDPPRELAGASALGFTYFPLYRLFVIGVTVVVLLALYLFLEKTNVGLILRAGSRDPLMVRALGFDLGRVWLLVFGIGAALAGLAGILAGPMRGVYAEMGVTVVIEAFVVVVVGGMGSLAGAVLAGLMIGEVVGLTTLIAPKLSEIMVFIVMAVVLLVRPSGPVRGAGIALAKLGVGSVWGGLGLGLGAAATGGALIGFLCLRRRGIYFAMLTLAFAQLLYFVVFHLADLTGGDDGLRGIPQLPARLPFLALSLESSLAFYYFALALVGLAVVGLRRVLDSPFGAVLQAIRENGDRAVACGYDINRVRLLSFVFSAALAGVAGGLEALRLPLVPIELLYWTASGHGALI